MTEATATRRYPPSERTRARGPTPANDGIDAEVVPEPARQTPVPTMTLAQITGDFAHARRINERLEAARLQFHLVSPATASPRRLPAGCSIAFTAVHVDIESEIFPHDDAEDSYGLKRSALQRIGHAAGVRWDPRFTRRTDDRSHPHYCSFGAYGTVFLFDGQEVPVQGTKEIDLRDGSEQAKEILASNRDGKGQARLRHARIHILSECETKAMLRAIRTLGLRSAYSLEELKNPVVVARLIWTGATDDPELRRLFALRQMDAMRSAARVLYGEGPARPTGPTAPLPVPPLLPAQVRPSPEPRDSSFAPPPPSAPAPKRREPAPSTFEPIIKFGNAQGTSLSQAKTEDLTWYANALKRQIQNPDKGRYRARNEADFEAVNRELARRGADKFGSPATTRTPHRY